MCTFWTFLQCNQQHQSDEKEKGSVKLTTQLFYNENCRSTRVFILGYIILQTILKVATKCNLVMHVLSAIIMIYDIVIADRMVCN